MNAPVVCIETGKLEGRIEEDTIFFGGVPYAAAPVGVNRFRSPNAAPVWDGVRPIATSVAAPQVSCFGAIGELFTSVLPQDEACLTLTVRSADLGDARLPVLVWLHGGGFAFGSGADPLYQSGAFARSGVVEVSVNYRLGAHGFALVDDKERGRVANLGLLDQLAALEWVQRNIASFGGDPSRVTLAGHSAGAMSVACLLSSQRISGLTHRAIIQSAAGPLAISAESARAISTYLAERLGIDADDLDALAETPQDVLLKAQHDLCDEVFSGLNPERFGEAAAMRMPFVPVVDGDVLERDPLVALSQGAARGIATLAGTTRHETNLMFSGPVLGPAPVAEAAEVMLGMVLAGMGVSADEVVALYRREHPEATALDMFVAVTTDLGFGLPTQSVAEALAPHADVYVYRFDRSTHRDGRDLGAIHGAELAYAFANSNSAAGQLLSGELDPLLLDSVHGAWVSFIETGAPSQRRLPEWPAYRPPTLATMVLDAPTSAVVDDPSRPARELWARLLAIPER